MQKKEGVEKEDGNQSVLTHVRRPVPPAEHRAGRSFLVPFWTSKKEPTTNHQ
jgi:hypothetical protein